MMIIKAKGTVVADINNRVGKRRMKGIYGDNWGGHRKRTLELDDYGTIGKIHTDAKSSITIKLEESKKYLKLEHLKSKDLN